MRRFFSRIRFLLVVTFCIMSLSGCGGGDISESEREQLREKGREMLGQLLRESYGWGAADYRILSEDETHWRSQGFSSVCYRLKVGDKDVTADVNIDRKEVFTDYYREEFEIALNAYLDRKMEGISIFREMSLQRASVFFYPLAGGYDHMAVGTIPASLTPDGFDAYLENCEQNGNLYVKLTVAWFSKGNGAVPEDLLNLLTEENNKIPQRLVVDHFACEYNTELQPTDWVESCSFDKKMLPPYIQNLYEYLKVSDKLVIRRTLSSNEPEINAKKGIPIRASFDNNGYLHITPGGESYDLFLKDMKEGTEIRCALEANSEPHKMSSKPEKTPYFDDWYMDLVRGWSILIEEK